MQSKTRIIAAIFVAASFFGFGHSIIPGAAQVACSNSSVLEIPIGTLAISGGHATAPSTMPLLALGDLCEFHTVRLSLAWQASDANPGDKNLDVVLQAATYTGFSAEADPLPPDVRLTGALSEERVSYSGAFDAQGELEVDIPVQGAPGPLYYEVNQFIRLSKDSDTVAATAAKTRLHLDVTRGLGIPDVVSRGVALQCVPEMSAEDSGPTIMSASANYDIAVTRLATSCGQDPDDPNPPPPLQCPAGSTGNGFGGCVTVWATIGYEGVGVCSFPSVHCFKGTAGGRVEAIVGGGSGTLTGLVLTDISGISLADTCYFAITHTGCFLRDERLATGLSATSPASTTATVTGYFAIGPPAERTTTVSMP
jgi:hypothetical protein